MTDPKELFLTPPAIHRPAPFWFWNDHLDAERLVAQFDDLVDHGAGGAVLHARGELPNEEYLSPLWFECTKAVAERAKERGVLAWLYDELGWPSGSAGKRVEALNADYVKGRLRMDDFVSDTAHPDLESRTDGELVAVFDVTAQGPLPGHVHDKNGGVALVVDPIETEDISMIWNELDLKGRRLLAWFTERAEGGIDSLNREATEAFIRLTHEEYKKQVGEHFGDTIQHIFMDEAAFTPGHRATGAAILPWTGSLFDGFFEKHGYDIKTVLPSIFFDVAGAIQVRYDFWTHVGELLREAFARPLYEWCEKNSIAYTGHYEFETTLKEQCRSLGSTMQLHALQSWSGIDILVGDNYSARVSSEAYAFYVTNIKQATSVAHQLGKPGVMSESYGLGGHWMGLDSMKTADDFQMALGITVIQHHASFYSIRGYRKADCPPFVSEQQPYWPLFKPYCDYTARKSWLLAQGEPMRDVLVLHPQESMQATYRHFRTEDEYKGEGYLFDADLEFEVIDKAFHLLCQSLLDAQIDFDLGDEGLMADHGDVDGKSLTIGKGRYRVVLVPPSCTIRRSTQELLAEFVRSGGVILTMGTAPTMCAGAPDESVAGFFREHARNISQGVGHGDFSELIDCVRKTVGQSVRFVDKDGGGVPDIKIQRRRWDDRRVLFVANVSRKTTKAKMMLEVASNERLTEWDMATGELFSIAAKPIHGVLTLPLNLEPRQSHCFVVESTVNSQLPLQIANWETKESFETEWTAKRTVPNQMVVGEGSLSIDGSESTGRTQMWRLEELVRGQGGCIATLTCSIEVEGHALEGVSLAWEWPNGAVMRLDGDVVPIELGDTYLDRAIVTASLPPLGLGAHTMELEGKFAPGTDLAAPIFLGDFDVVTSNNVQFRLAASKGSIPFGSWLDCGMAFYAGGVRYRTEVQLPSLEEGQRWIVDLTGLSGSARVKVAGVETAVLWHPLHADISHAAGGGVVTVEIEVFNTLRNMLGPHYEPREHHKVGFGEDSYMGEMDEPMRFIPYGLTDRPIFRRQQGIIEA